MEHRIFDVNLNIKFNCLDDGLTNSINRKIFQMNNYHKLASVVIDSTSLPPGSLASFSFGNEVGNFGVPMITLHEGDFEYDRKTKVLQPTNINNAFYLHHELMHFIHFCIDDGVYTHPNLKGMPKYDVDNYFDTGIVTTGRSIVKANEIECGWRCLNDDMEFDVAPLFAKADRQIQLKNIFAYETGILTTEDDIKMKARLSKEGVEDFVSDCVSQMKFSRLRHDKSCEYIFHWDKYAKKDG